MSQYVIAEDGRGWVEVRPPAPTASHDWATNAHVGGVTIRWECFPSEKSLGLTDTNSGPIPPTDWTFTSEADQEDIREARRRLHREGIEERECQAALAQQRAKETLLMFLNPEQAESLEREENFQVKTEDGLFLIERGFVQNIWCLEGRFRMKRFCIQTREDLPLYDQMLIQKILLECDFGRFLSIANY